MRDDGGPGERIRYRCGAERDRRAADSALALWPMSFYARIEKEDAEIGAFLTLSEERARAQAARIDEMAAAGRASAAAGGSADRDQRCDGDARRADDRGIEDSGKLCASL